MRNVDAHIRKNPHGAGFRSMSSLFSNCVLQDECATDKKDEKYDGEKYGAL